MTAPRAIRGTKAKVFLYLATVLIITGLIACYNNTLSQLEDIRRSKEVCQQQQENLSTQLQVITDYKIKLEKSLKNEKAEHQQSKKDMQVKIGEAKTKGEKASNDALLKYNSLQQHYNLLKTEHDDFKDESAKAQQKQLDEINSLKAQLDEVKEELKKVQETKESLKTQFTKLELEAYKLKSENTNASDQSAAVDLWKNRYTELDSKYLELKKQCDPGDTLQAPLMPLFKVDNSQNNIPPPQNAAPVSSSTQSGSKHLGMGGVKPLIVPTVTPKSAKKPVNLKVPQGVVPAVPAENQNEQPELSQQVESRKIEGKEDNGEKDNGAHEVFDVPVQDPIKNNLVDSNNLKEGNNLAGFDIGNEKDKKVDLEYKDMQHEEDDEVDGYQNQEGDGPPVRN